jgi:hypothetical protein
VFIFTVAMIILLYSVVVKSEYERRKAWNIVDEGTVVIDAPEFVWKQERFIFENFVSETNDASKAITNVNTIMNIRTRNNLTLSFGRENLDDAPIPTSFAVYPESGSGVDFRDSVYLNTKASEYIKRLSYWSLMPVERGQYIITPGMFPQVCLSATDPGHVEVDRFLHEKYVTSSNNTYEFILQSPDIFYIRKPGTKKYLAEVEVGTGMPTQARWVGIDRADRFIIWSQTMVTYPLPKVDLMFPKVMSTMFLNDAEKFVDVSNTTSFIDILRDMHVTDKGDVKVEDKGEYTRVHIVRAGIYREDNWQCQLYAFDTEDGKNRPARLCAMGNVKMNGSQCPGDILGGSFGQMNMNSQYTVKMVANPSDDTQDGKWTSGCPAFYDGLAKHTYITDCKITSEINSSSASFAITRAFPYDFRVSITDSNDVLQPHNNPYYLRRSANRDVMFQNTSFCNENDYVDDDGKAPSTIECMKKKDCTKEPIENIYEFSNVRSTAAHKFTYSTAVRDPTPNATYLRERLSLVLPLSKLKHPGVLYKIPPRPSSYLYFCRTIFPHATWEGYPKFVISPDDEYTNSSNTPMVTSDNDLVFADVLWRAKKFNSGVGNKTLYSNEICSEASTPVLFNFS